MAFIPNGFQPGEEVELRHDVRVLSGTFTQGHKFKVVAYEGRGYTLEDKNGERLSEAFESSFKKI